MLKLDTAIYGGIPKPQNDIAHFISEMSPTFSRVLISFLFCSCLIADGNQAKKHTNRRHSTSTKQAKNSKTYLVETTNGNSKTYLVKTTNGEGGREHYGDKFGEDYQDQDYQTSTICSSDKQGSVGFDIKQGSVGFAIDTTA